MERQTERRTRKQRAHKMIDRQTRIDGHVSTHANREGTARWIDRQTQTSDKGRQWNRAANAID